MVKAKVISWSLRDNFETHEIDVELSSDTVAHTTIMPVVLRRFVGTLSELEEVVSQMFHVERGRFKRLTQSKERGDEA